jgi:hypothetical protein
MSIPVTRIETHEESELRKISSKKSHDRRLQSIRSMEAHLPKNKRTKFLK